MPLAPRAHKARLKRRDDICVGGEDGRQLLDVALDELLRRVFVRSVVSSRPPVPVGAPHDDLDALVPGDLKSSADPLQETLRQDARISALRQVDDAQSQRQTVATDPTNPRVQPLQYRVLVETLFGIEEDLRILFVSNRLELGRIRRGGGQDQTASQRNHQTLPSGHWVHLHSGSETTQLTLSR